MDNLTVVASGFEDPNALLDGRPGVSLVVGRVDTGQECDIDAKRFRCELLCFADSLAKSIGGWLGQRGEDACKPVFSRSDGLNGKCSYRDPQLRRRQQQVWERQP